MATKTPPVTAWKLPSRYTSAAYVGHGTFGAVASATDTAHGRRVAVKAIFGAFGSRAGAGDVLREIRILRHLAGHEQVLRLLEVDATATLADILLVTPFYDMDLHRLIHARDIAITPAHARWFAFQLLRGLAWCHSAGILHRDLKPGNVLLTADCALAIADFGTARALSDPARRDYVTTRWYRAPEVLAGGAPADGTAADVFSAGLIIAEFFTRAPLAPGENSEHQAALLAAAIDAGSLRGTLERTAAGPDATDLLLRLLAADPRARPSALDAMRHPYLAEHLAEYGAPAHPDVYSEVPMPRAATRAEYLEAMGIAEC